MSGDILIRIRDTIQTRINQVEADLNRLAPYLTDDARRSLTLLLIDLEEQMDYVYELHQTTVHNSLKGVTP